MKHFLKIQMGVVYSLMTPPPPTGRTCSVNGLMSIYMFENMGRCEALSNFGKGHIAMARRLGQSTESRPAVLSTDEQRSEEAQITNRQQRVIRPRLIDARGQRRPPSPVKTDRRANIIITGGTCHNTQCIAPCCVWGFIAHDE